MAVAIKVPDMGESVIEATVARWMKQEGEAVSAGEPVVELETDKINLEVGAQQAGVLSQITRQAGETVAVGDVLAYVDAAGQAGAARQPAAEVQPAAKEQPAAEEQPAAQTARSEAPKTQKEPDPIKPAVAYQGGQAEAEKQAPGSASAPTPSELKATPVAQRMAQDLGLDLGKVSPSGAGGRVTKEDVEAFIQQGPSKQAGPQPSAEPKQPVPYQGGQGQAEPSDAPGSAPQMPRPSVVTGKSPDELSRPPAQAAPARASGEPTPPAAKDNQKRETRVRMTRRRQTIARRLVEAQHTAAMLTTFNEIDMSKVMELRKRRREAFKERFGVDLGFMSFFVKASIGALKAFPQVNAELASSAQGDEIVLKHYYDIGVAIGAEEGLVVPVIRDADRLNFAGIEQAIKDFAQKARSSTLTLEDLRGGTFTITNGGVYGSLMSTPILNPPQVAILGMHAIKERPVVVNGEISVRPMMYVALSYDHRVVDGREAVQFLVRIKELVEDPEALLFG